MELTLFCISPNINMNYMVGPDRKRRRGTKERKRKMEEERGHYD